MPKFIFKLLSIFFVILLVGCAKRGSITGGYKDTIAPVLTASFPKNFSTNFNGKEIKLVFDEYVKLKNLNKQLIVSPQFRNMGLATQIKERIFELSREKYPNAKIFGLTTGMAVMKINSSLGYKPVIYSELTQDEQFWNGCKNCVNYEILMNGYKTIYLGESVPIESLLDVKKYFDSLVYVCYATVEPTKSEINNYITEFKTKILDSDTELWLLGRMTEFIHEKNTAPIKIL